MFFYCDQELFYGEVKNQTIILIFFNLFCSVSLLEFQHKGETEIVTRYQDNGKTIFLQIIRHNAWSHFKKYNQN